MDLAADNFIIEVINFIEKEGAYNLLYENHGQTIDFISKFNRSHPGISMQLIRGTYINFWIAIYYKKMQFQNETSFTENILNSVKYKNRIKFHTEENDKNIKYNTVLIHFDIEEKAEYAYISDILIKVQKKEDKYISQKISALDKSPKTKLNKTIITITLITLSLALYYILDAYTVLIQIATGLLITFLVICGIIYLGIDRK